MSQLEYEWYVKAPVCEKLSFSSARNIKSSSKKMQTFLIFDFSSPFSHLSLVTLLPSVNVLICGCVFGVGISSNTLRGEQKHSGRAEGKPERREAGSLLTFFVLGVDESGERWTFTALHLHFYHTMRFNAHT